MAYFDYNCLDAVPAETFRGQKPYPLAHMRGTLTDEGWSTLRETLPDIAQFRLMVGVKRGYGQAPHNRGILHYRDWMTCAEPWKGFIAELHGRAYDSFLRRMLGLKPGQKVILTMEWYYAW